MLQPVFGAEPTAHLAGVGTVDRTCTDVQVLITPCFSPLPADPLSPARASRSLRTAVNNSTSRMDEEGDARPW